ncbi:hypothetical protein KWH04_01025 [Xanthomonas campestris pv. trichodesmae]|uniref:Uncharacterized protein n=2 Tax=Xanthomonas citri TaxID=346 RepID=A0AB33CJK2_XANCI|nr:hypothetical protein [Xanthomonas citri]ASK91076.1 hypothetical protein XcvCFBP7111P_05785 [Xanthomonas citri pv. vignicola]MBV6779252.1 hypothetical protein [Xanthomonas campestris pv. trichodesmae]MBZ3921766.1 hypothetical protein [Xanthomonas campestris pv. trichodesmae]MBZ3926366.1 hypothetical protein [Xanthomonas citri pv. sesbaniae]
MQLALLPRELSPDSVLSALQGRRGAANGITARDLVFVITLRVSAADERRLRQIIEKLRRDGHPICAHPAFGYHLAADANELDRACSFLLGRAMTSLQQISAMKRVALPDLYGQLGLKPPITDKETDHEQ